MQKLLIGFMVAAAVVTASIWLGRPSGEQFSLVDCGVDQAERDRLMALDVRSFDQDFDGGWRAVSYRDGCELAAVVTQSRFTSAAREQASRARVPVLLVDRENIHDLAAVVRKFAGG